MKKRNIIMSITLCTLVFLNGVSVAELATLNSNVEQDFNLLNGISYCGSGQGDIFYVGGGGPGNFTRIQDAIDNASNGDTVFVFDESSPYYEHVIVDKRIRKQQSSMATTPVMW